MDPFYADDEVERTLLSGDRPCRDCGHPITGSFLLCPDCGCLLPTAPRSRALPIGLAALGLALLVIFVF